MNNPVLYPDGLCPLIFFFRLATKVTIAGGALYVACDSGLLGSSEQGAEALEKAKTAVPPAIEEWMKYFGVEVQSKQFNCLNIISHWDSNGANVTHRNKHVTHI